MDILIFFKYIGIILMAAGIAIYLKEIRSKLCYFGGIVYFVGAIIYVFVLHMA